MAIENTQDAAQCAAIGVQNLTELSAWAFLNDTQIDPYCFEAGTNLSKVAIYCLDTCQKYNCENAGKSSSDLMYTVTIQVLTFLLVFGLAGSVDFGHFKERFRSRGVYIGLLCQFFLMPLIGFAVVAAFNDYLPTTFAVTLLVVVASPGGSYSNWWCNLINADLAISVAMTTVSTIVSAAMLPINIIIYIEFGYKALNPDSAGDIVKLLPYSVIGYTLANVICAVILGLLCGYHFPKYMGPINKIGTLAGFLSIALGVFGSSQGCVDPWGQDPMVYLAVLLPLLFGIALAQVCAALAGLPAPQRVAVAIETAYQNSGIALAVALSLGAEGRAAAIVPVMYGGYEACVFSVYCFFSWQMGWTLSPETSLKSTFKMAFGNYQYLLKTDPRYGASDRLSFDDEETAVVAPTDDKQL